MDPLSLIVTALATGAGAALKDTAGQAVKDAYTALKGLLGRKVAAQSLAQDVISKHEQDPEVWRKPLESELGKADVAGDPDIVQAARRLLELADPKGAATGKYSVTVSGGKGVTVGDHAQVTMTFNEGD
jgi:hypothetical protein